MLGGGGKMGELGRVGVGGGFFSVCLRCVFGLGGGGMLLVWGGGGGRGDDVFVFVCRLLFVFFVLGGVCIICWVILFLADLGFVGMGGGGIVLLGILGFFGGGVCVLF